MADLVKSKVKCYKKKTKKMVAGETKVYEYNQYQVPLKKSDNLGCSEEVFIIPEDEFEDIIEAERLHHQDHIKQHRGVIADYENELKDLEWKHGELSRSYKVLVSKNAQTNKRLRLAEEKNTALINDNQKLKSQLKGLYKEYQSIKELKGIGANNKTEKEKDSKKEPDLWSSIRSRLSSREVKDREER